MPRAGGRSPSRAGAVLVLSTAGSREEAERIGDTLVKERLAACVNLLGPITSLYWWAGARERSEETLLLIKSVRRLVPALAARIAALHSYEVPEIVVLPVIGGAAPYLAWIASETAKAEAPRPRRGRRARARGR
jgi:periplasmic divalent cation tolerance protein